MLSDDSSVPVDTSPADVPPSADSLGPRPFSPFLLLLRTLAGLGAGLVGSGVIFVIALLGSGILQSALGTSEDGTLHPLFIFVFMAMMFVGSATANHLGSLFIALGDRDHYQRLSTTLTQIFVANLVILIALAPVYMIAAGLNTALLSSVAALQVIVSAFATALILEIIADYRYALLGVYSTAFAVLVSAGVYFLFYSISVQQPLILLLLALPVMWTSIGLFGGLLNFLYGWIYKLYGVDFLSGATVYGADERWETEEEETKREVEKIERSLDTGANFLGKMEKK